MNLTIYIFLVRDSVKYKPMNRKDSPCFGFSGRLYSQGDLNETFRTYSDCMKVAVL